MQRIKQSMVESLETALSTLTAAVNSVATSIAALGSAAYVAIGTAAGNVVARDAGGLVGAIKSSGVLATTSGTAIDSTGIPSTAKRVTVIVNAVSTNGSSAVLLQLGTSVGVLATGYTSDLFLYNSGGAQASGTQGHMLASTSAASNSFIGRVVFEHVGSNIWIGTGHTRYGASGGAMTFHTSLVGLSGALDRIRLTTANGTDLLDAGQINVFWES